MKRIAVTQLALLKWAKTRKKGFTVKDAAEKFGATLQATAVRLEDAFNRGWLGHAWERNDGGGPRSRYTLSAAGAKMLAVNWVGKGRFRVPEKKTKVKA